MQSSALFFGGALVGAMISAACGFDLFDASARTEAALASARARSASLESRLSRAETARTSLQDALQEAKQGLSKAEADLAATRQEVRMLSGKADRAAGELSRVRRDLEFARAELADAGERLATAREETSRCREERAEQVVEFFSTPRRRDDVPLVHRFLLGEEGLDYKRRLVLNLRRFSPEILLSLCSASLSGRIEASCADEGRERLVPTSSRDAALSGASESP